MYIIIYVLFWFQNDKTLLMRERKPYSAQSVELIFYRFRFQLRQIGMSE